jgi:hypothetical protein
VCRLAGDSSLLLLHLFHPLLEILLSVGFRKFLKRFIQPFGLTLDSLITIPSPASVIRAVIVAVVVPIISSIGKGFAISPALGTINTFTLIGSGGRRFGDRRGSDVWLVLVPRLDFVSVDSVSWPSLAVLCISGKAVESPYRAISNNVAVLAIFGLTLLVAEVASHTTVETFGTFVSKTLARLHRAPALCFALAITTTETIIVATIAESIDV